MHAEREEELTGGHDSGRVVRIGGTVRRPARPRTSTVHALLSHLASQGVDTVPRPLGFDEVGREILTWIPGDDGRVARCYDDASLVEVAEGIRDLHRAASSFVPPRDAVWRPEPRGPAGDLVVHGDLNPANAIYRDGRLVGIIDWDHARPSTALWDLSYAARTFVPLYAPADAEAMGYLPGRRGERLRIFCDAYGMGARMRSRLIEAIGSRLAGSEGAFADRCRRELELQGTRWERALLSVGGS